MKQETLNSILIGGAYVIFIGSVLLIAIFTGRKPVAFAPVNLQQLKEELRQKNDRIRELRLELETLHLEGKDRLFELHQYREENRLQAEEIQRLRDELAAARGTEHLAPTAN